VGDMMMDDGWMGVIDGELRGSKQREITGKKTERQREEERRLNCFLTLLQKRGASM